VGEEDAPARWRTAFGRVAGVRVRAALAALAVVAVILAVAAVAFVVLQRRQLEAALTDVAAQGATAVASQVAQSGAATASVVPAGRGERALIQIVTPDGVVVASSAAIVGEPPVVDLRPTPGQTITVRRNTLPIGESEAFAVVVRGVAGPGGPVVVISAQSLETAQQATSVLIRLLAVGYPVLLLLVAGTSYWLTGLALAPVEVMRRRVAGISATDPAVRVPVPPSRDEVAQLATTMNAMLQRLADSADAQRRFVADASHELRSPLASIRAAHEIAAVHPQASDFPTLNTDVLAEVSRLERLVNDLLFLARSDEDGARPQIEEVDLDDLVADEAHRLGRTTGLHIGLEGPPVRVAGDRNQLTRALRNLVDNAARHATDHIEIRTGQHGREAVIDVIDDGPGIPAPERERVFERFVRLDASRQRADGGAGLGLAIAREIARSHGGELSALEHPNGAHLQLRLPLPPVLTGEVFPSTEAVTS
jgi:signal transduction histidine kinase